MRHIGFAALAATAALAMGITAAQASLLYDTALQQSDYYNGGGNTTADGNSHWSTDEQANNVELGLGVVERYLGWYTPDAGTSTYHVPTGATAVSGKSGSVWGFEFSINTGSQFTLDTVLTSICLTDVGNGTHGCFDPQIIPDNTVTGVNLTQNSEALSFSTIAGLLGDPSFDINADDTYIFDLTMNDVTGAPISSVSATVITGNGAPAPEPATLALFGSSLAGMGFLKRKLRKAKA